MREVHSLQAHHAALAGTFEHIDLKALPADTGP
jgi:hypothetical protein